LDSGLGVIVGLEKSESRSLYLAAIYFDFAPGSRDFDFPSQRNWLSNFLGFFPGNYLVVVRVSF
jgi:hypothetical protein